MGAVRVELRSVKPNTAKITTPPHNDTILCEHYLKGFQSHPRSYFNAKFLNFSHSVKHLHNNGCPMALNSYWNLV